MNSYRKAWKIHTACFPRAFTLLFDFRYIVFPQSESNDAYAYCDEYTGRILFRYAHSIFDNHFN